MKSLSFLIILIILHGAVGQQEYNYSTAKVNLSDHDHVGGNYI